MMTDTPTASGPEGGADINGGDDRSGGRSGGLSSWLTTTDHKRIGLLYIGSALVFFLIAIGFALTMRTQLIRPDADVLSPGTYNQIFTMHGTLMVFLFAMPILAGLGNYLVPLMIGARDMAFPRLNALSYWVFAAGSLLLLSSFLFGGAPDAGWFSYTPLASESYSPHDGVSFWILSLILLGSSSIMGSVNFIVTMLRLRAPGMKLRHMPVFAFATFVNAFLIMFAIPSLTVAVVLLYLDRHYGTAFYEVSAGGDPILWQHLFWFFGHPEVYILILPAFGIMSEVVPVFSRKPLFGRTAMLWMIFLIGFLGFLVWAHHMFAAGLGGWVNAIFAGSSMIIAVPTGVKIFNWLATMWGGALRFSTPLHFTSGFIALFTVGGLTGVTLAVVPFDWQVTDSYYVVAHLHNVLFGGTLFAVFAGFYYWFPKVTGRLMNDGLGKVNFWLLFVGFMVTFLPMYALGLLGMPRRIYTFAPGEGWELGNLVSSIGGYIIAAGIIAFLVNVVWGLRSGKQSGGDPWDAWTLEWATGSPPPSENFSVLPAIRSARPLWDEKHPERADWHLDADAREAEMETLERTEPEGTEPEGTEPKGTEPEGAETGGARSRSEGVSHASSLPMLMALGGLATVAGGLGQPVISALGVIFMVGVGAAWLWERWTLPKPVPTVTASGTEIRPTTAEGHRPWVATGTLLFIASEAVFFGALIAAYVHLRTRADVWPPEGLPSPDVAGAAINTVILIVSGVLAHWGVYNLRRRRHGRFRLGIMLAAALGVVFLAVQGYEFANTGFGLSDGLLGSTFFTLTGFHGAHVAAGVLLLLYTLGRAVGPPSLDRRGLAESAAYYWHFVDGVWLVLFATVYLW